jgi:endonuclease V-like protein UPF0215 family
VRDTSIPVITIVDKKPNIRAMEKALERTRYLNIKKEIFRRIDRPKEMSVGDGHRTLFIQNFGITLELAREVIQQTRKFSAEPEPIRAAKFFAYAIPTSSELKRLIR